MKCENCGAQRKYEQCEYCGSPYHIFQVEEVKTESYTRQWIIGMSILCILLFVIMPPYFDYVALKDAVNILNKKKAEIKIYEKRIKIMEDTYKETPREYWSETDLTKYYWFNDHIAELKRHYNHKSKNYNTQIAKINWSFCNVETLPKGITTPLPREFVQYAE